MFNLTQLKTHKSVLAFNNSQTGLTGFIALHTGNTKMPSFGATRFWRYVSADEALEDALRLSKFMSYKAALADLPYGGAKAVILDSPNVNRETALKSYPQYVDLFAGRFITGADIGVSQQDVKNWRKQSKYFVGVNVDPVKYTILGIVSGIKTTLKYRYGSDELNKRTFAIQGLGKIGSGIIEALYGKVKTIYVTDVVPSAIERTLQKFPKLKVVSPDEIFSQEVDVLSPCALYGALNKKTLSQLRCKIVAGGANNQLTSDTIGLELAKKEILFAPDFVLNAGGMISVVDEFEYGKSSHSRLIKRISVIDRRLTAIFEKYTKTKEATNSIANKMAESIIQQYD